MVKYNFKDVLIKILNNSIFMSLFLSMVFTRSFYGLKIFGFRLGELAVGFGLFLIIIFCISQIIKKNYFSDFPSAPFYVVLITFLCSLLLNKGSLFSQYTFKSSSFLWMVGYIFLGYSFFRYFKFTKLHIYLLAFTPYIIYIFNSGNYPNFIMGFFGTYSDKFQFIKGADVLMALVFCIFLLKDKINTNVFIIYFNITGSLLLPLFLTLSRASFFSGFLFLVSLNLLYKNEIKNNLKKYAILILFSIFLFILSAVRVAALPEFEGSTNPEPISIVQQSVTEVVERKNTNKFFLGFYFCENRLCSTDNTLDWRLDIWNDLVVDQLGKNKLIFGFGFNEIFEVMKDPNAPGRLGRDGLNENVHNHIFTIIGRMGLIGLVSYLFFQVKLLSPFKKKVFVFILPLFLVSSFDTTMESVQFPLLYYFLISFYYSTLSKS